MVCLRNICINTLHKGDNDDDDNNNYHTHYGQPLDSILSQINPTHIPKPDNLKIHFNIITPSTTRPSKWSPTFVFFTRNFVLASHLLHPGYIPVHLLTLITLHWQYKTQSPSTRSFPRPPVNFSPLCLNVPL